MAREVFSLVDVEAVVKAVDDNCAFVCAECDKNKKVGTDIVTCPVTKVLAKIIQGVD